MKVNTVDTIIQDFQNGQNIFRRPSVELLIREISRLNTRLNQLEEINQAGRNKIAELEAEIDDKNEYIVRTGVNILSKLDNPLKALEELRKQIDQLESDRSYAYGQLGWAGEFRAEKVCEWVREKTERGWAAFYIPKDHEQHRDCYTQDADVFTYCPNCGKRIVYKDKE